MNKINKQQKKKTKNNEIPKIDLKCHSIQELFERAVEGYSHHDKASSDSWSSRLAESGTRKDKISAVVNLLMENPHSSLRYFEMLLKWTQDGNKNFALDACEALKMVFSDHVFSEKGSLKIFVDSVQDGIRKNRKNSFVEQIQLIRFYLEHQIKQYYRQYLATLKQLLESTLTHIKKACLKILAQLAKYEQLRRMILELIINKLGDQDMNIVNEATKCLKTQFYEDLQVSEVLMEEIQRFLFRANLRPKAQFYVVNFLNNINLKFMNEKSMGRLFEIFYHFFSKFMDHDQKKQDLGSRLFLNSIKGLNKLFSFMKGGSKANRSHIDQKLEAVYKTIHTTPNTKAKIQLLLFIFQAHTFLHNSLPDRYYRTLYQFLNNEQMVHSSLVEMFFDLLLISMKEDEDLGRVLAMVKRILHICLGASSGFIVTSLILIDKLVDSRESLQTFLNQRENMLGEDEDEMYDITKREPKYANAAKTCLWELRCFEQHYHPLVRKYASAIIHNKRVKYEGPNPLIELSVTSLVEKLSLRKEKKSDSWKMKVRRNLSKIRSSKYESILDKPLHTFQEDEQFIKHYLEQRKAIHNEQKRRQPQDIEQFADQLIEAEMDRLNPDDMTPDYSITPDEDDEEADEGESEGNFIEDDFDEGVEEQMEEEEQEQDSKQFEDVLDEMEEEKEYPSKTKKIQKPFNKNKKSSKKWKRS